MNRLSIAAVLITLMTVAHAQRRPPEIGRHLPDPGPNRVEVRFAVGETAVTCKRFSLTGKVQGRVIISGKFASGFEIPTEAANLPLQDAVELEFKCGKYHWHFSKVGERAFLAGWWWVGTDHPPFQETFQGWREFQDAVWIRYLIVDPSKESGFFVERHCPARFENDKHGPCCVRD